MTEPKKRRARGDGAIEELPDGRWKVRLSYIGADGKRKRPTRTFKTKKAATAWRDSEQAKIGQGKPTSTDSRTLAEWLEEWLKGKKTQVGITTFAPIKGHVANHINPSIGHVKLAKLQASHVKHLYATMEGAGVSRPTQRHVAATLTNALNNAVREDVIVSHPMKKVDRPKTVKVEIVPLDPGQTRTFLRAAEGDRFEALYVLAIDSGMRQGELYGLHWPEIDWQTGTVSVIRSLAEHKGKRWLKPPKTASGKRKIKLTAATVAALNAHRQRQLTEGFYRADGPVFVTDDGAFVYKANVYRWSFQRVLRKAIAAADKAKTVPFPKIRFHDLRHTSATLLLLGGVNIKAVSVRLGHAKASVTLNVYSHFLPVMDDAAAAVMSGHFASGTASGQGSDRDQSSGKESG